MRIFETIIPSELNSDDKKALIGMLQNAVKKKQSYALIKLSNGLKYKLDTNRLNDYINS